jgi:cyclopropane fatty-acyl-phospholipid synthase-like methyltransferase
MADLPHSAACERNRDPILGVLKVHFADRRRVLEIGSGTGQHAVHFAAQLPHLSWQTSDRDANLEGIRAWLHAAALPNTPAPLRLDVREPPPLSTRFDAVFSANTLHIMGWDEVGQLVALLDRALGEDAVLAIYGPFRRAGAHTSESNARFDADLKQRDARMGVRDLEAVHELAAGIGLAPSADIALPANNACLVWRRTRA